MSLSRAHPLWSAAIDSYSVNKAVVVARMLSGRYRVGSLLRHFSPLHNGACELCGQELEDLPHILLPRCPHLLERGQLLCNYAREMLRSSVTSLDIFEMFLAHPNEEKKIQFFLDPTVLPEVIAANQVETSIFPTLLRITMTWCYSLHRTRLKLLGRWI